MPIARPCANCGGVVGADGYCETCGTKAPSERDHYTEQPATWVAACCDRGIRHHRNEDATAVARRAEPGLAGGAGGLRRGVHLDRLRRGQPGRRPGGARPAGRQPAGRTRHAGQPWPPPWRRRWSRPRPQANAAVIANTAPDSENAASCTFAAAVLEGDLIVLRQRRRQPGLLDPRSGRRDRARSELSVDDSVAQARIAMGVPREEAENGPQAHAITKWLGRDSPDFVPHDRLDHGRRRPAGCWSAPTGCGTTPRRRPPCRR